MVSQILISIGLISLIYLFIIGLLILWEYEKPKHRFQNKKATPKDDIVHIYESVFKPT